MVYANVGVTFNLSVEAFTSTSGSAPCSMNAAPNWNSADPYGGGCNYLTATNTRSDQEQADTDFIIPRDPDDEASDSGQWGISARYFVESLNASEFGIYYLNLHSRTPIFSGRNATNEFFGQPFVFGADPAFLFRVSRRHRPVGLTFATNVGEWAWSGELSYRDNFPPADQHHGPAAGTGAGQFRRVVAHAAPGVRRRPRQSRGRLRRGQVHPAADHLHTLLRAG